MAESPSPELVDALAHATEDDVAAMDAWWRATT